ncbi:MAG: cation-translocating P-type ATPase [Actinomycetota bacterium]
MEVTQSDTDSRWWAEEAATVVEFFESDAEGGLTSDQVAERQAAYGPNELEEEPATPLWRLFLSQFADTMIVVLIVAAGIMVAIGEPTDAIVIGAILVLNAGIGFVQEYRAERAMAALRTMAAPNARVVRDGSEQIVPAVELVPGDLVVLDAGDLIAADGRLVEAPDFRVNEAALTGESVPVDKTTTVIDSSAGELVGDRQNMVFKGTAAVYGRSRAVIVGIGMNTALGQIAGLLKTHKSPPTPLQRRLASLGRWLAFIAVVICLIVFATGVARGEDVEVMFLTSVSLAVAAIPEALPAVVTIGLALGAQRMIHHHTLIRKLPAVETLGSVTVICTDKTGTLTEGRMLVERVWTLDRLFDVTGSGFEPNGHFETDGEPVRAVPGSPLDDALIIAALCNDASLTAPGEDVHEWGVVGDPTEGALLALAAKGGWAKETANSTFPRVGEIPFDSARKRMVTLHQTPDGNSLAAVKGAIEATIDAIDLVAVADGTVELTPEYRAQVLHQAEVFARQGYRVLSLAGRRAVDGTITTAQEAEEELVLYGLAAMADPPRSSSAAAVEACRTAGITPVMITGDHPATGEAIARRLGLIDGGERVMTGMELAESPESLVDEVSSVAVYARTSPEQKLDIVEAWQARGDVVAMTGDGVNDAPALRRADIGVAMGITGTEVAKEAAEMVLTDDNFASIVTAIGEGRRIFDNIRRFVKYTLTSNTGEIIVMFFGPFLGLALPLQPVQILWINLVTDGFPGLALGVEPEERDVMHRPPRPPNESIFARGLWQRVVVLGTLMGAIALGLGLWGEASGRPWQTMLFTTLALLQLGYAFAVRSEHTSLFKLGLRSNTPLLWTVVITLAIQIVIVYWAPMQTLLHTEALSFWDLMIVLAVSSSIFWVVEAEKLIGRTRTNRA